MPNADAYAAAMKLLQWFPVRRIEADPGASPGYAQFAFSPDGRFLVVMSYPSIRLIETASGKELGRIEARDTTPFASFRFSADSRLVLIGGENQAQLISMESAKEVFSVSAGEFTSHNTLYTGGGDSSGLASMSPDGRWLALTAEDNITRTDSITVIDAHTGKEASRIEHPMNRPDGILGVRFSPNGELLAT